MKRRILTAFLLALLLVPLAARAAPPRQLVILPEDTHMFVGDALKLTAHPLPVSASSEVVWNSTNQKIAQVDADGLVTATGPGTVKIRARAKDRLSVFVVRTLTVTFNPSKASLSIAQAAPMLSEGDQVQLTALIEPSGTGLAVQWTAANPRVAEVDGKGRVWALRPGTTVVTASIEGGPSAHVTVVVREARLSTVVPARSSDANEIAVNLNKIDAVRESALGEVNRLYVLGAIPAGDANRRILTLTRAFAMYRFPWMTEKVQRYWTRDYGTRKDFFPGVVYYGLPYIQHGLGGNHITRTYNEVKAVAQGFYKDSGKGYYLMTAKRRDGMYVGNDCSSFVGMSLWGAGSRNALIRTRTLYTTGLYRTLPGYEALRPSDILVKNNRHVVFFLYYVDAARSRMMILEQGGGTSEDMHNTLCCSIVPTSKYQLDGYRPRRLSSLSFG